MATTATPDHEERVAKMIIFILMFLCIATFLATVIDLIFCSTAA